MTIYRNRNFTVLLSGQLLSMVGNNLFAIALPWYVYTLTGSKGDLAWTGIAQTLPSILGLFAGVFVDRSRKRVTMMTSDTLRAVLSAALVSIVMLRQPFWTVLIVILLLQAIGTFFNPAAGALLPMIVSEDELPAAAGVQQSSTAVAQLVGTLSGGALLAALGSALLFACDGVSFLISTVSVLLVRAPEDKRRRGGEHRQHSFLKEWIDGVMMFRRSKFLLLMLLSAVIANFGLAPFEIALTAWVKGPLHGNAFHLGLLFAAFFVGIICGGLLLGVLRRRIPLRTILLFGFLGIGVMTMAIGLYANFVYDFALIVGMGLFLGAMNGSIDASFATLIPAHLRGRAFATLGALVTLAMPLGMAFAGVMMVHTSIHILFLVIGALTIVSGLAYLLPVGDDLSALRAGDATEVRQA